MRMKIDACGSFNKYTNKWEVNLSSILTQLIFDAAKYCDRYASDLFIDWQKICETIDNIKENEPTKFEFLFGFRECGIDSKFEIQHYLDCPGRYRKIRKLIIEVNKIGLMFITLK